MTQKRPFRSPALSVKLDESGGVPARVQLFRVGTFHHSEYGKFEITKADLKKMSDNFTANIRGIDIAIDYKHDNEDVAAGWVKSVSLSEDGLELWADVDWTPNGKRVLAEKEFRYLSPEFMYDYQDNESLKKFGPTLLGAGLTNRPTIKNMEPVVELAELKEPGAGTAEPTDKNEGSKQKPKEVGKMDYKAMDPAALEGKSPEELKAMVVELIAQLKAAAGKETELSTQVAAAAEEKKMSEKKATFAKMLSDGKVVAAQEEAFLADDTVKFAELAGKTHTDPAGNGGKGAEKKFETADEATAEVQKLAEEKLAKKEVRDIGTAISLVLAERDDLRQKIYA